jgi:hypothetical protein
MYALDMSRVSFMPFAGSGLMVEPIPKTGDARKWQMVGEYTMEMRNRLESHALHTNLT